jgi:hypothetical protein
MAASAQTNKTAAIMGMYVNGIDVTPELLASIYRIELNKITEFQVLDKLDMSEIEKQSDIVFITCYGRECLQKAGEKAKVDYVIAGSAESLGGKMVVSFKLYDINTKSYVKTQSQEFINSPIELQRMVRIVLHNAYQLPNVPEEVEMLAYYEAPPASQRSKINNSGPRMGLAFIGGQMGDVLTAPESQGGYDVSQIVSQFGYQFEQAYISSGNFQALAEFLITATGIEQNLFIPGLTFINGFRNSSNGWEIGFGPTLSFRKFAKGYMNANNEWTLGAPIKGSGFETEERIDSRGIVKANATWVWAMGKTFRSGYLNIPVNAFFSHGKSGWYTGLSMGFNISK